MDGPVRERRISPPEIEKYLIEARHGGLVLIPDAAACLGARILARPDGLFVADIELDASMAFRESDLDDLALAICMLAKSRLGHTHDVHRPGGPSARSVLRASQTLIVYPVELAEWSWPARFQARQFSDADLRAAVCSLPIRAPAGDPPRNGLVCLRRGYLKVFEDIIGRLAVDRDQQVSWQKSRSKYVISIYNIIVVVILYSAIVEFPHSWEEFYRTLSMQSLRISIPLMLVLFSFFFFFLIQFLAWDRPRIRLLRSSVAFYEYANPLNRVIARVLEPPGHVGEGAHGFQDVIALLRTKTEGEVHRSTNHHLWLSLSVGFAGILFAALAIQRTAPPQGPHHPPAAAMSHPPAGATPALR